MVKMPASHTRVPGLNACLRPLHPASCFLLAHSPATTSENSEERIPVTMWETSIESFTRGHWRGKRAEALSLPVKFSELTEWQVVWVLWFCLWCPGYEFHLPCPWVVSTCALCVCMLACCRNTSQLQPGIMETCMFMRPAHVTILHILQELSQDCFCAWISKFFGTKINV